MRAEHELPMAMKAIVAAAFAVMISAVATHADPIDPAQAIAQKFSDASDEPAPKPPASKQPSSKPPVASAKPTMAPAKPDADYEADMLQRARAEELDRTTQQTQKIAVEPVAAAAPAPPPAIAPPAPSVAALPAKSEIERPANSADAPRLSGVQATVLLVLDTDSEAAGSKPDPIICIDDRCWISSGIEAPAAAMPRRKAQALKTTEEATPDSCAGKSACVYRGITIEDGARIEVIEVGDSRGTSAGAFTIAPDKSCRKDAGGLLCENGLATHDFRIWVVPEAVASSIGINGLEDAVAEGLPDPDTAASNDK